MVLFHQVLVILNGEFTVLVGEKSKPFSLTAFQTAIPFFSVVIQPAQS
jgi:hypothetical protein